MGTYNSVHALGFELARSHKTAVAGNTGIGYPILSTSSANYKAVFQSLVIRDLVQLFTEFKTYSGQYNIIDGCMHIICNRDTHNYPYLG